MAGKRPDQYRIDANEGRGTDHKFNPQNTHGKGGDMPELRVADKQRLTESQKGGQPFMPDVPAPSAEAQRAAHEAGDASLDPDTQGAADTSTGAENPLA
jgi:hypothetical protein